MEEKYISILENLKNQLKVSCSCVYLDIPEKQAWLDQIEALDWVIGKLNKN